MSIFYFNAFESLSDSSCGLIGSENTFSRSSDFFSGFYKLFFEVAGSVLHFSIILITD
jgi:hypothetical protein